MTRELFAIPVTRFVTGDGTPIGVTVVVAARALVPIAFVVRTDAVYVVLFVRPEIVHVKVEESVEQVAPPGDKVAV